MRPTQSNSSPEAMPRALRMRSCGWAREARHHFAEGDVEVVANIGLSRDVSGAFVLSAGLAVTIAGVDQKTAGQFVEGAHAICPYSNAIRGNVDVQTTVSVR